ncbi:MAG: DUF5668 domain-containing protein [Candidatus Berkelbacteria bacterium]|nr:DUF5668 domain-containing protein [Candidatus Berkelbacteria bacterium]
MKFSRIFWGLLVVLFGVLLLGVNLSWWNWSIFADLFAIWPLVLIVIGANLVFESRPIAVFILFFTLFFAVMYLANFRNVRTSLNLGPNWSQSFSQHIRDAIEDKN